MLVMLAFTFIIFPIFGWMMERLSPYAGSQTPTRLRTLFADYFLGIIGVAIPTLLSVVVYGKWWSLEWSNPLFMDNTLARILIALLVYEAYQYATHRLMHTKLFWPLHALHHSSVDMHWSAAFRHSPLTRAIMFVPDSLFLAALGMNDVILIVSFISGAFTFLGHVRADISFGSLNAVFVTPHFHRIHHSSDPAHYNRNFSGVFSFIDHLFGTAAKSSEPIIHTGLKGYDWSAYKAINFGFPISALVTEEERQVERLCRIEAGDHDVQSGHQLEE